MCLKWLSMPSLMHPEATALCLGYDPAHYPSYRHSEDSEFASMFLALEKVIERKFPQRDLRDQSPVPPSSLYEWAIQTEWKLPSVVRSVGRKLFGDLEQGAKLRAKNRALVAENARLLEEVAHLKQKDLLPKERRSLLLIINGMAQVGYRWDPSILRSEVPSEIAKDTDHRVTAETVLKYLRLSHQEAKAFDDLKR